MHFDVGKSFEGNESEENEVGAGVEIGGDKQVDTESDAQVETGAYALTVVGRNLEKGIGIEVRVGIGVEGMDAKRNPTAFRMIGPFFPLVPANLPPLSPPLLREPSSCSASLHLFPESVLAASLALSEFLEDVAGFAAF